MERSNHYSVVLRLLLTKGVGPSRVGKILRSASENRTTVEELVDCRALSDFLAEDETRAFGDTEEEAERLRRGVEDAGGVFVSVAEGRYPEQLRDALGDRTPPLLTVAGNRELLESPSVGFCGSRKASEKGLGVARDCAEQLGSSGVGVVSGHASGVDVAAHESALRAGGTTVLVLPEGFLRFRLKKSLRECWDEERGAVVSEFLPSRPWRAHNAMQRNLTICGLSRAMILIEAARTGGSIQAGRSSLKLGIPLFAAEYQGMPESAVGNRELLSEGAKPLLRSKATGRAILGQVLAAVASERRSASPQSGLFS